MARAYRLLGGDHALSLAGDFVECGVFTGLLSVTICRYLDFSELDRVFWLFDTWSGIPTDGLNEEELAAVQQRNAHLYGRDVYEIAKRNFADYPNVRLVRGALPGTLGQAEINSIAYLSIDLNSMAAERDVIEALWPKLTKGAIVVLDDYGFEGMEDQHDMWDKFAASQGTMIATLPTGQGLLIK